MKLATKARCAKIHHRCNQEEKASKPPKTSSRWRCKAKNTSGRLRVNSHDDTRNRLQFSSEMVRLDSTADLPIGYSFCQLHRFGFAWENYFRQESPGSNLPGIKSGRPRVSKSWAIPLERGHWTWPAVVVQQFQKTPRVTRRVSRAWSNNSNNASSTKTWG